MRDGVASFNFYDSRGDVTTKTNSSGAVTFQTGYEAFGSQTVTSGSTLDRQRASTKEQDPTGLLNEGFRYRDPSTGTFLTRDPLGFKAGLNNYTYVHQNPWTHFDPEGLDSNPPPPPPPPPPSQHAPPTKTSGANSPSSQSPTTAPSSPKPATSSSPTSSAKTTNGGDTSGSGANKSTKGAPTAIGQLGVDTDGTGSSHGDKSHQNSASGMLDKNGNIVPKYLPDGKLNPAGVKDLNADKDAYGVAPKQLSTLNGGPLQPGDKEIITTPNGKTQILPIGDFGPNNRNGEMSVKGVQNQGYSTLPGTSKHPYAEPSPDGKTTPNISARVQYIPNSHSD
jgi:RHS repeat-associated protein